MVHNGIIENYATLRSGLETQGHVFRSETDTEAIAHLIEECHRTEPDPGKAFLAALKLLVGTYGIAAVFADSPGHIFAARHGSPMVIGIGDGETTVASDPSALVTHTRRVVYLEDGETAVLSARGFNTHDPDAIPIDKEIHNLGFDLPAIERNGYAHFMLKEIFEEALRYLDALEQLPEQAAHTLACDEHVKNIADLYASCRNFLYIGRLYEYPVALEGALKLKEISYIHAEGIPAAELKHGSIALVDENMPTVVLAAQEGILDKVTGNVHARYAPEADV